MRQHYLFYLSLEVCISYCEVERVHGFSKFFARKASRNACYKGRNVVRVGKKTYGIAACCFQLAFGYYGIYIFAVFAYDKIVYSAVDVVSSAMLGNEVTRVEPFVVICDQSLVSGENFRSHSLAFYEELAFVGN